MSDAPRPDAPKPNTLVDKTAEVAKTAERTVREQASAALHVGHDVVRAGIGAVGAVQEQGAKLFDALVHRGARTEEGAVEAVKSQVGEARSTVEARTQSVAARVGGAVEGAVAGPVHAAMRRVGVPTREEVQELAESVALLSQKVDALMARLDATPTAEVSPTGTPTGTPAHS